MDFHLLLLPSWTACSDLYEACTLLVGALRAAPPGHPVYLSTIGSVSSLVAWQPLPSPVDVDFHDDQTLFPLLGHMVEALATGLAICDEHSPVVINNKSGLFLTSIRTPPGRPLDRYHAITTPVPFAMLRSAVQYTVRAVPQLSPLHWPRDWFPSTEPRQNSGVPATWVMPGIATVLPLVVMLPRHIPFADLLWAPRSLLHLPFAGHPLPARPRLDNDPDYWPPFYSLMWTLRMLCSGSLHFLSGDPAAALRDSLATIVTDAEAVSDADITEVAHLLRPLHVVSSPLEYLAARIVVDCGLQRNFTHIPTLQ